MRFFLVLLAISGLQAQETVLYDVDYTRSFDSIGETIPLGEGEYPGRTTCSAINSGNVKIGEMPGDPTKTAAMMRAELASPPISQASAQLEFRLGFKAYSFRKHRIEMKFLLPANFSVNDNFTILTDGGVTYSLKFHSAYNTVFMAGNVLRNRPVWGDQIVTEDFNAGACTAFLVDLVWESDATLGTSSVTINGVKTSISGLSILSYGSRNWMPIPGPLSIRLNVNCSPSDRGLALQKFRVVGSDYDGPLYNSDSSVVFEPEADVVTIPLQVPSEGSWQPEYSTDGSSWIPYGYPLTAADPIEKVAFGSRVAPRMTFRLRAVAP